MSLNPVHFVGVNLVFIKDNKVLLLKRKGNIYGTGLYCFPAGHVEGNETVKHAAVREASEELGVRLDIKDLDFIHVSHRNRDGREYISFFLIVNSWNGILQNNEPEKHDIEWIDINNIPKNSIYVAEVLNFYKNKIYYSEEGW